MRLALCLQWCKMSLLKQATQCDKPGLMCAGASRSLPQQTHDSAASSASLTPPRSGYPSRSLPATPPGSKQTKDPGPLGISTSLLQRSSRGSASAAPSERGASPEGAPSMDTSQLAAKAFSAAGHVENAEPLSVALQMKAAAAIAAELPAATGEAADTLGAKVQDLSATSQARRSSEIASAAQRPVSQADEDDDDRVPLELTRTASRRLQGSTDMPAALGTAPEAAQDGPQPSYLSPEDDEPQPLSMSIKGGLPILEPMLAEQPEPDQDAQDADEPEPLSMSIKAGSLRPYAAPPPAEDSHADEPEPLLWGRKSAVMPAESPAQEEAADEPEPLSMTRKSRPNKPPVWEQGLSSQNGSLDAAGSNSGTGLGSYSGSLRGSAESYKGLLMSARDTAQPATSGFTSGGPQVPGSGQPGQADEPSTGAELEPEPLAATRKPSSAPQSIRAGTPRPSDRLRPRECFHLLYAFHIALHQSCSTAMDAICRAWHEQLCSND